MWGKYIPKDNGVINDAYGKYSEKLSSTPQAVVEPLLYDGTPDAMGGPYFGTIGIFVSTGAIVNTDGPFLPKYFGNYPISEQPHIISPDPWNDPDSDNH